LREQSPMNEGGRYVEHKGGSRRGRLAIGLGRNGVCRAG
jgi:hypothetical protein